MGLCRSFERGSRVTVSPGCARNRSPFATAAGCLLDVGYEFAARLSTLIVGDGSRKSGTA